MRSGTNCIFAERRHPHGIQRHFGTELIYIKISLPKNSELRSMVASHMVELQETITIHFHTFHQRLPNIVLFHELSGRFTTFGSLADLPALVPLLLLLIVDQ